MQNLRYSKNIAKIVATSFFLLLQPTLLLAKNTLIVHTDTGALYLYAELADTPEAIKKGLMHRKNLPINNGMLFDFGTPRIAAMWMKDTLIPLDMLFIDKNGIVIYIKEYAQPHSEAVIMAPSPVRAVFEMNAGLVQQHNIRIGSRVSHAIFQ